MNEKPTQQQQPATVRPESELQKVLNQPAKGVVEFVPYGADAKIKLSVAIIQNLVAVKTKLGKTCSEQDAIKFLAMCQSRRMNPFEGDCYLIGYDSQKGPSFALITAHQTYLKRAELHPEFDGMRSGLIIREDGSDSLRETEGDFFEPGQEVVGGWAIVYFKNRKQPMYKRLRLERFKKPFGIWQEDPAGMICKCAEADALRSSFPTMLGGLYMREEIEVGPPVAKPDFSSPTNKPALFARSTTVEVPSNGQTAEPVIEAESEPQAEPEPPNPLETLRGLLAKSKLTEASLLDYLASTGSTDGSLGALEELAMTAPEVVNGVVDQWNEISGRMIAALKKGGAK